MNPDYKELQKIIVAQQAQINMLLQFKNEYDQQKSAPRTYYKNVHAYDRQSLIGFFGADPVSKRTVSATATDAATTQTLANSLRTLIIALGLAA